MSLTASYRTEIVIPKPQLVSSKGNIKGTPCMEILCLAMEKVRREHQGEMTAGYRDCRGRNHQAIIGVKTASLPNGIGVNVTTEGRVVFEYDREGANAHEAEALCRDVSRAYAVIAVLRAQNRLGYNVTEKEECLPDGSRQVIISSVRA